MTRRSEKECNETEKDHLFLDTSFASNKDFCKYRDDPIVRDTLVSAWNEATGSLQCSKKTSEWFELLWDKHTTADRHYHTAVHLFEMLGYSQMIQSASHSDDTASHHHHLLSANERQAVLLAIFFHDAVYDATSATNEEDSAKLFQTFADEVQLSSENPAVTKAVTEYILATKTHQATVSTCLLSSSDQDHALAHFLDLDLAVLGKEPDAYLHYAKLIRREYHFVPRDTYCAKRAEILESFMQQNLFATPYFQALEERARNNLLQEIQLLRQNIIPGDDDVDL